MVGAAEPHLDLRRAGIFHLGIETGGGTRVAQGRGGRRAGNRDRPPVMLKVAVRLVARGLAGGADDFGRGDAPGALDLGPSVARVLLGPADCERLGETDAEAAPPGPVDETGVGVGVRAASPSTTRAGNGVRDRSATCSPTTWTAPQATPVAVTTPASHTPTSSPGRVTSPL